jgi:hypothetical protein
LLKNTLEKVNFISINIYDIFVQDIMNFFYRDFFMPMNGASRNNSRFSGHNLQPKSEKAIITPPVSTTDEASDTCTENFNAMIGLEDFFKHHIIRENLIYTATYLSPFSSKFTGN